MFQLFFILVLQILQICIYQEINLRGAMKNVLIFHIKVILGVWNCSPLFPLKLKFEMY